MSMLRRSAPVAGRSNFRSAVSCEIIKVFFGRALLRPRTGALRILKTFIILLMAMLPLLSSAAENRECVILLHGLCRTSRSMAPMERALTAAGYHVLNVDYPSRTAAIEKLDRKS